MGQFIQARLTQKLSHARDPRIRRNFENWILVRAGCFRTDLSGDESPHIIPMDARVVRARHGPEFQERKSPAVLTHSFLSIEDWPFRRQFDDGGNNCKHRREKQESQNAPCNIHRSLQNSRKLLGIILIKQVWIQRHVRPIVAIRLVPALWKEME